MKKLILLLVLFTTVVYSQKTCESSEESLEDLNSITKCTINSKKNDSKSRQISVRVSASKNRFLKKRKLEKKSVATSASGLSTSGVSETNHSSEISNSLSLKKEESAISNIATLTNTLSAEEVKKAQRFSTVDRIPLFDACKGSKGSKSLDCFNQEMINHIQKHFRYPHNAVVNKVEGDVWVRFIIDKDGVVSNIKTLGPKGADILDEEASRVVSKLPKFIPGKKDGNNVSVKYGFPISFSLEE